MINIKDYLQPEWQLLYMLIIIVSWYFIDKAIDITPLAIKLTIILAIPTYLLAVFVLGPTDINYTPEIRDLNYGSYFSICILPGSIISAIIAILYKIIDEIKINKAIKKEKK